MHMHRLRRSAQGACSVALLLHPRRQGALQPPHPQLVASPLAAVRQVGRGRRGDCRAVEGRVRLGAVVLPFSHGAGPVVPMF